MARRTIAAACALLSSNWDASINPQVIPLADRRRRVYGCDPDCRAVCQEEIASDIFAVPVMPSLCRGFKVARQYRAAPRRPVSACVVPFCTCRLNALRGSHGMERDDIKQGEHYMPVGMCESCTVEMVEEGGQVTFRDPIVSVL